MILARKPMLGPGCQSGTDSVGPENQTGAIEETNLEERIDRVHRWLLETQDDLGDLARLLEAGLARQGLTVQAHEANKIAHKWEFRRNRRNRAE